MTYGDLDQRSRSQGKREMLIVCLICTLNISDTSCRTVVKLGKKINCRQTVRMSQYKMTFNFDLDFYKRIKLTH